MSNDLYLALEECLAQLQLGEDLESCLRKYPADADLLRPLLSAAIQARALADDRVPQEVIRRSRVKFLNQAAEIREERRSPRRQSAFSFQRVLRFSFALLLAVVILIGAGGTGLVSASGTSLPGDRLYVVKLTWENLRLRLANSEQERVSLEDEFGQERLAEVGDLLSRERQEKVKFTGRVDSVQEGILLVSGVAVLITPETRIDGQILPGAWVKVEGWTAPGGVVNASRIRLETSGDENGDTPGEDRSGSSGKGDSESSGGSTENEIGGESGNSGSGSSKTPSGPDQQPGSSNSQPGQSFDLQGVITAFSAGSIQLDGRILRLDGATEIRGQLTAGSTARVRGFIDAAGNWVVTRIEMQASRNPGEPNSGGDRSGSSSGKEPTKTPKPD